MVIKVSIKKNCFRDALHLMRISKNASSFQGVQTAIAVMGTEMGKFALEEAGLLTPEAEKVGGGDLVMAVYAESEEVAETVLTKMNEVVSADKTGSNKILNQEIRAINIGLEIFKEALESQGVNVAHVDWRVPAEGDTELVNILKKMY